MGISNKSQSDYCRVCSDEEELETVEHFFCNCPAVGRLRLKTFDRGFCEGLNSMLRADIKALIDSVVD